MLGSGGGRQAKSKLALKLSLESSSVVLAVLHIPENWPHRFNIRVSNPEANTPLLANEEVVRTRLPREIPLTESYSGYLVQFFNDDRVLEKRRIPGFVQSEGVRWGVFAEEGLLLPQRYRDKDPAIPAKRIWLCVPEDIHVLSSAITDQFQEVESLEEVWLDAPAGWRAQLIDTTNLQQIRIERRNQSTGVTLEVARMPQWHVHPLSGVSWDGLPVCSTPPVIENAVGGVKVRISSLEKGTSFNELCTGEQLPQVLAQRIGRFRISWYGKLGEGESREIALIPGLHLRFDPPVLGPGAPANCTLSLQGEGIQVHSTGEDEAGIQIKDSEVILPTHINRLCVNIVVARRIIPLSIRVPRLVVRYRLPEQQNVASSFERTPLLIPQHRVRNHARLWIDLKITPELRGRRIRLFLIEGDNKNEIQDVIQRSSITTFDLAGKRDTILRAAQNLSIHARVYNPQNEIEYEGEIAKICLTQRLSIYFESPFTDEILCLKNWTLPWIPHIQLPIQMQNCQKLEIEITEQGIRLLTDPPRDLGKVELPPGEYIVWPKNNRRNIVFITINPGNEPRVVPPEEKFLREIAHLWSSVWSINHDKEYFFDENKARRAAREMQERIDAEILRFGVAEELWRHMVCLWWEWGKRAHRAQLHNSHSWEWWQNAIELSLELLRYCLWNRKINQILNKILREIWKKEIKNSLRRLRQKLSPNEYNEIRDQVLSLHNVEKTLNTLTRYDSYLREYCKMRDRLKRIIRKVLF